MALHKHLPVTFSGTVVKQQEKSTYTTQETHIQIPTVAKWTKLTRDMIVQTLSMILPKNGKMHRIDFYMCSQDSAQEK